MIKEKKIFDVELESDTAVQVVDRLRWWRLQRVKEQPLSSDCYIYNNNYHNYSAFGTRPLSTEVQKWLHCQRHALMNKQQETDKNKFLEVKSDHTSKESLAQITTVKEELSVNDGLEQKEEQQQPALKTHSNRAHSMPQKNESKEHGTTNHDNTSYNAHDRSYHSEQLVFVRLNSDNEIVADNKMPYTEISKLTEPHSHNTIIHNDNSDKDSKQVSVTDNKSVVDSPNIDENQCSNTKVNSDTKTNTKIIDDNNMTVNPTQNEENVKINQVEKLFLIQNTINLFRRRASSTPVRLQSRRVNFMVPNFTQEMNSFAESEYNIDKMSNHVTTPSLHASYTVGEESTRAGTMDSAQQEHCSSTSVNANNESESFFHTSCPSEKALVLHHPPRLVLYSKHFPLRRLARAAAIKRDDVASNELMKESAAVMHVGNLPLSSYERVFYNRQLFSSHLLNEAKVEESMLPIESNKNISTRENIAVQHSQILTNSHNNKEEKSKSEMRVNRVQVKRQEEEEEEEELEEETLRREKQEEYDELKRLQKLVEEEQESNTTSLPASPVAREGRVCILTTSTNTSEMTRARHLRVASQPPLPPYTRLLSQKAKAKAKAKTHLNKTKQMQSTEKVEESKGENVMFVSNTLMMKCDNPRKVQLCRYVEELQDAYVFNPFVDCIGTGAFSQVYAALPILGSRSFCADQHKEILKQEEEQHDNKNKCMLDAVAIKVIARKAKHKHEKESDTNSTNTTPNQKHYPKKKNNNYNNNKKEVLNNGDDVHTELSESSQRRELMEIEREIGILRRLRHTGCSVFYEALRTREEFVIVMKLHHGSLNLRQFLDTFGVPSERRASLLLFQLLTTVHYLHNKFGVVHRDIKLENLLVSTVELSRHAITQCIGDELYKSESTRTNVQMQSNFFTNHAELLFDSHHGQDEMLKSKEQNNNNNNAVKEFSHSQIEEHSQKLRNIESKADDQKELSNTQRKENQEHINKESRQVRNDKHVMSYHSLGPTIPRTPHSLLRLTLIDFGLARRTHLHKKVVLEELERHKSQVHKKGLSTINIDHHHDAHHNSFCNKEYTASESAIANLSKANNYNNNNNKNLRTSNSYNGREQEHTCHDVLSGPATPFTTSIIEPTTSSSTFASVELSNNNIVNNTINKDDMYANKNMHQLNNWRRHVQQQQQNQKQHHHQLVRPASRTTHHLHEQEKEGQGELGSQNNAEERMLHSLHDQKNVIQARRRRKQLENASKVKSRQQSAINRALPTPLPSTVNLFTAFYDVEDDEELASNSSTEKSTSNNSDSSTSSHHSNISNKCASASHEKKLENCLTNEELGDNLNTEVQLQRTPYSCEINNNNKEDNDVEDDNNYYYMRNNVETRYNSRSNFTASMSARSSEAESVYINSDNDNYDEEDEEEEEEGDNNNKIINTNIDNSCKEVGLNGDCKANNENNVEHDSEHENKFVTAIEVSNINDRITNSVLECNRHLHAAYNDKCNHTNQNFHSEYTNNNNVAQEKLTQSAPHQSLSPLCSPSPIPHRSVSFQLEQATDHTFAVVDTTNINKGNATKQNMPSKCSDVKVNKTWLLPASASTPEVVAIACKIDNINCQTPTIMRTAEENESEKDNTTNKETSLESSLLRLETQKTNSSLPNVENKLEKEHKCHRNSREPQNKTFNYSRDNNNVNVKCKNYRVRTLKSGKMHEQQRQESRNTSARDAEKYNLKFNGSEHYSYHHDFVNREMHAMESYSPEMMRAAWENSKTHEHPKMQCTTDNCASVLLNSLSSSRRDNEHEDLSTWLLLTPCGTEKYLAPEMLEWIITHGWIRKPTTLADAQKLDMYAIGVVTYVLLSGCFPFNGSTQGTLLQQQRRLPRCSTTNWQNVSRTAIQFVQGLLEPDPALRFSAEEALSHPFMQEARKFAEQLELIPCEEVCGAKLHEKCKNTEINRNMLNTLNTSPPKSTDTAILSTRIAQSKSDSNDLKEICTTANTISATASQEHKSQKESGKTSNDICQRSNFNERQTSINIQSEQLCVSCTHQLNASSSCSSEESTTYRSHEHVNEAAHSSVSSVRQNSANAHSSRVNLPTGNNSRLLQTQSNELHSLQNDNSSMNDTNYNIEPLHKTECIRDESDDAKNGAGSRNSSSGKETIRTNAQLKTNKQTVRDNNNINHNNDDTILSTVPCEYDGSFLATAQSHSTLATNTSKTPNSTPTQMLWSADHDDLFDQLYDNIIRFDK